MPEPRAACRRLGGVAHQAVDARARFEAVFETHHRRVLAYALRRTASEADAEDVTAETFAIAWRRVGDLPPPEDALPWLLATARRVAANHHRGRRRWFGLLDRLRAEPMPVSAPSDSAAAEALERLGRSDQELLRLLAWDGLSQAEAGEVLGVSSNAVAIRLHRARKRFAAELQVVEAARMKGLDGDRTPLPVKGRLSGQEPGKPT